MVRAWVVIAVGLVTYALHGAESNPPPRIVFLSPTCDAYFVGGIDSSTHLRLDRKGNFRKYYDHIGYSGYIGKGTWTQDSNGIIRIIYVPLFWGRDLEGRETYAAIWEGRDKAFLVEDYCITNLVVERDKHVQGSYEGWHKTSRLDYEMATGGVNFFLGILVERGHIPLWLALGIQNIISALFFVFPILAAIFFLTVKPMTQCPACGASLSRRSVKMDARIDCKHCKTQFEIVAEHDRHVARTLSGIEAALVFWLVLLLTTKPVITSFSRALAVFLSLGLAFYSQRVLYARWLFGHIGKGITLVPKEPKQR